MTIKNDRVRTWARYALTPFLLPIGMVLVFAMMGMDILEERQNRRRGSPPRCACSER